MGKIADFAKQAVDDVVSFALRPFGIYTHDETFTDIQIHNLLTPDQADKAARRSAIRNSGGDSKVYHTAYRSFQRQYKRRYSKKFLESVGYDPSSTATTRVIDESLLTSYLQTALNYNTINIVNAMDKYMGLDERSKYGRQFVTGYDHITGSVTVLGLVYAYSSVEEISPTGVRFTFVRNFSSSIIDNLTSNYSYNVNDNTITVSGEVYDVGVISSLINLNDEYETVCTHQGGTLPDIVVTTDVERYQENFSDNLFDDEVTYVEYRVTSGEIDTATRYFIASADTLSIYITASLDMTAIIPMKEDNVIVNDSKKLNKILKKLNLSHEQLIESLQNPDMDSAYLITGLDTSINDNPHNKVMFKTFDSLSAGSGNITISISRLSMTYSFTMAKNTYSGVVGSVGTYSRSGRNSGGITLRFQGSSTQYQEIVITNYVHRYVISGRSNSVDFEDEDTRIIIPLDIMNSLNYKDWVQVYERSLSMIGYAVETVEVKWYETAAFGFLLQIVAIVWTVLTLGADGGSVLAFVQALAINFVVYQAVLYLAQAIGGDLGAIIASAIMVYMAFQSGDASGLTGSELWLSSAASGLATLSQALSVEMEKELQDMQDEMRDIDRELNEITDRLKEQEEDPSLFAHYTLPFESIGSPNNIFQTTEEYVNSIINTDWLVSSGWLYDIEGEVTKRNQVYTS